MKVVELVKISTEALKLMSKHDVLRDDIRMSLIFIGNATSGDQWWDTTAHELLYHAACAIWDYYDVPYGSEDAAWTVGYLMRKFVQLVGEPCK